LKIPKSIGGCTKFTRGPKPHDWDPWLKAMFSQQWWATQLVK